jgi:anti-sigma-K factor RskA
MATHEELHDLYELYALGVLEPEERAEIDRHLATGCGICQTGVKRAAIVNTAILSFAPDAEPSKKLKRRLLAGVGVEPRSFAWIGWAAATACLLVAAIWFNAEEHRRSTELADTRRMLSESNAQVNRVQQVLDFLNSPDTKQVNFGKGATQPPKGNILVNPTSGVLLIASNLPPLPAGRTYEMWVIPKGGAPKPAGLFQSDARGTALHFEAGPVDVRATGAVAVSVEPLNGSTAPTTTPIIVAAVGP